MVDGGKSSKVKGKSILYYSILTLALLLGCWEYILEVAVEFHP